AEVVDAFPIDVRLAAAHRERPVRRPVMIDLSEDLGVPDPEWHIADLDRETCPSEHDRRGRIDRHQPRVVNLGPLVREKKEGPVPPDWSTERRAPLLLGERRLVESHSIAKDVELVEVVLGVQALVAEVEKCAAVNDVRSALGHDVDYAAGSSAELR